MTSGPLPGTLPWVAVVLAGGGSRRWGGADKTAHLLAGEPLLAHAVAAVLPAAELVTVVAPADHPARAAAEARAAAAARPLLWTREDPPGSGPVAGLAAGLAVVPPPLPGTSRGVALLAGDVPFSAGVWPRLVQALADHPRADGALGVDPDGRRQLLLALVREHALREQVSAVPPAGQPLRTVLAGLVMAEIPVSATEALDLDTPQDAAAAERIAAMRAAMSADAQT